MAGSTKPRSGYQTADEFYEQYYRDRARALDKAEQPKFGTRMEKRNLGLLVMMAGAIAAITFWNKNRKKGTRLGKEPDKPAVRRGLTAGEAAARAAEQRQAGLKRSPLTPLGKALAVARKVDTLEDDAKRLEVTVQTNGRVEETNRREQLRLIELVTQAQIEMDGIQVDESGRGVKKAQIVRMERIIVSLEKLAETAHQSSQQKEKVDIGRRWEIEEEEPGGSSRR